MERTFAIELTYNEVLTLVRVLKFHEDDEAEPLEQYEKELAQDLVTELIKTIGGM